MFGGNPVLNTGYGNSGFYNAAVNNTAGFATGVMRVRFFNFGTGTGPAGQRQWAGFFKNSLSDSGFRSVRVM